MPGPGRKNPGRQCKRNNGVNEHDRSFQIWKMPTKKGPGRAHRIGLSWPELFRMIRNANGADVFFAPREAVSAIAFEDSIQANATRGQPPRAIGSP